MQSQWEWLRVTNTTKVKQTNHGVMNKRQFVYKNQKAVTSRFGGTMYYLFFNDGERSYRTCVDTTFRNYTKWERLINNITKGDIVLGLVVKSKGMIDADSTPRYGGNIFKNATNEN
jgi:hypothetical protein